MKVNRPTIKENRRPWRYGPYVERGYRNPRLNPSHIEQATDTFAVGFVDYRIRVEQAELEARKRK